MICRPQLSCILNVTWFTGRYCYVQVSVKELTPKLQRVGYEIICDVVSIWPCLTDWCFKYMSHTCACGVILIVPFKCDLDLCDVDYVGYTCQHLFQRIDEHKNSAVGKHLCDAHNQTNKDLLQEHLTILKKCCGKCECLIYEILFIQEKKPMLNTQSDSIKANLFSAWLLPTKFHIVVLFNYMQWDFHTHS